MRILLTILILIILFLFAAAAGLIPGINPERPLTYEVPAVCPQFPTDELDILC